MVLVALSLAACEANNAGYAPAQPIAYSHAVHAGALSIDCQYCHYSAERSRFAGIPPAQICMNCHGENLAVPDHPEIVRVREALESGTPIEWARVHRLPDHATFDHSAHVNADVACHTCHGPVESMGRLTQWAPLTMGWCVDCHRTSGSDVAGGVAERIAGGDANAPALSTPERTNDPTRANRLTDCAVCHH